MRPGNLDGVHYWFGDANFSDLGQWRRRRRVARTRRALRRSAKRQKKRELRRSVISKQVETQGKTQQLKKAQQRWSEADKMHLQREKEQLRKRMIALGNETKKVNSSIPNARGATLQRLLKQRADLQAASKLIIKEMQSLYTRMKDAGLAGYTTFGEFVKEFTLNDFVKEFTLNDFVNEFKGWFR